MINILILLAGVVILGLSLGLGIVLPIERVRSGPASVPRAHVLKGAIGAAIGLLILVVGLSGPFVGGSGRQCRRRDELRLGPDRHS